MASKVRFGEQIQPRYPAGLRELMPHRIADGAQAKIRDNLFAKTANRINIAKYMRRTTFRVHQPLGANIHDDRFRNVRLELAAVLGETVAILTTNGDRLQGEIAARKASER